MSQRRLDFQILREVEGGKLEARSWKRGAEGRRKLEARSRKGSWKREAEERSWKLQVMWLSAKPGRKYNRLALSPTSTHVEVLRQGPIVSRYRLFV